MIGVSMYSMILVLQASAFASIIRNDVVVGDKRRSLMQWAINELKWRWIGTHTKAQIDHGAIVLKILIHNSNNRVHLMSDK